MKAYAKINIFLKILGRTKNNFHTISSRFVLLESLYDELYFTKDKSKEGFEILNDLIDDNIIKKAYVLLCQSGYKNVLDEFFSQYSLVLVKNIPMCAGLGGGSSNCASFLRLINETLNLKLTTQELINLSTKLGSDVAFFLSGFKAANVSGCGEIIKEFKDDELDFKLYFNQISCSTKVVYDTFDKLENDFYQNQKDAKTFEKLSSSTLLTFENHVLNDLLKPCIKAYPRMSEFVSKGFLSGSGSSVFGLK